MKWTLNQLAFTYSSFMVDPVSLCKWAAFTIGLFMSTLSGRKLRQPAKWKRQKKKQKLIINSLCNLRLICYEDHFRPCSLPALRSEPTSQSNSGAERNDTKQRWWLHCLPSCRGQCSSSISQYSTWHFFGRFVWGSLV